MRAFCTVGCVVLMIGSACSSKKNSASSEKTVSLAKSREELSPLPKATIESVDATHYKLDEEAFRQVLLFGIAGDLAAEKVQTGYKISQIRAGSIFARLGLSAGDVVEQIGSVRLTSGADSLVEAYAKAREKRDGAIEVGLLRDGHALTLHFDTSRADRYSTDRRNSGLSAGLSSLGGSFGFGSTGFGTGSGGLGSLGISSIDRQNPRLAEVSQLSADNIRYLRPNNYEVKIALVKKLIEDPSLLEVQYSWSAQSTIRPQRQTSEVVVRFSTPLLLRVGLSRDTVIASINGKPVQSTADLLSAAKKIGDGDQIKLSTYRLSFSRQVGRETTLHFVK